MELPLITPHRDKNGVMLCSELCPQHDGKRCQLQGFRPDRICYPWAHNTVIHIYDVRPINDPSMRGA